MRSPRACWPHLAEKAEKTARHCQGEIAATLQRLTQLQASRQRLLTLYDEYHSQEKQLASGGLGMASTMNQRQFMGQLLSLQQRVDLDIQNAQSQLAQQQKALAVAQIEMQKMRALVEQEKNALQRETQRREQRQLDDFGVMHFNLRRSV